MANFEMEAIAQAVAKAVVIAMSELKPEARDEILLENYVPAESVRSMKQTEDYPQMLTIQQAAALLGVTVARMYEVARSKNTPFVIWGKNRRMCDKYALLKYLEERRGGYMLDEYKEGEADE